MISLGNHIIGTSTNRPAPDGLADIATSGTDPEQYGLPTLPKTEIPPCGSAGTCNRTGMQVPPKVDNRG